jgi:NAD(P)-dependent dehydrogenase (short-subunit alcohol dehydrogenase family)
VEAEYDRVSLIFVPKIAFQAVDRMKQEVGEGKELKVEYLLVDLASFASVKDFVKTFKEKNLPLHILINNAAVCGTAFCKLGVSIIRYCTFFIDLIFSSS